METQEFIQTYIAKLKDIHQNLCDYFKDESESEVLFNQIMTMFQNQKFCESKSEFKLILHSIAKISTNLKRTQNFYEKILKILKTLLDDIKKQFTEEEILDIFRNSKRIILFFFEEKVLIPSKSITNVIANYSSEFFSEIKHIYQKYHLYFYPELHDYFDDKLNDLIDKENPEIKNIEDLEAFNVKRRIGENEEQICQLIRNDSIKEFIIYVSQHNYPLDKTILASCFETNDFLLDKKNQTLIEYAAFFGSIQIFQYLQMNKIALTSSLWPYAIHGGNEQILYILEENKVIPKNKSYEECIKYAVKFNQFEICNYLKNNLIESPLKNENQLNIEYYNFSELSEIEFDNNQIDELFYNFCKYDYIAIVDFLLKNSSLDFNKKFAKITKFIFFVQFQMQLCIQFYFKMTYEVSNF